MMKHVGRMVVLVGLLLGVVGCGQPMPEEQAPVSPPPEFSPAPGLEPPVGVTPMPEPSPEASPEADE